MLTCSQMDLWDIGASGKQDILPDPRQQKTQRIAVCTCISQHSSHYLVNTHDTGRTQTNLQVAGQGQTPGGSALHGCCQQSIQRPDAERCPPQLLPARHCKHTLPDELQMPTQPVGRRFAGNCKRTLWKAKQHQKCVTHEVERSNRR